MTTPLAYPVEEAGDAVGVSRTRIFEAIRNNELTARKAGRATIIEATELRRWLSSLPTRGAATAATEAA
jgi:excisionase family DNA binding protein